MTNYTKATDFASKDALLTGNPSKIIKGVDINVEFAAIEVAIATKCDSADLGASGGGALIGYLPQGTGAVATTVDGQLDNAPWILIKNFLPDGYVTDGTVDYTTYFQAALDAGINATYGTGRTVLVPDGKWQVGDLQVARTGQVIKGESKYGTWLIAKSGCTAVIQVGDLVGPTYRRHTTIEKLSIDYTNIANTVDSAGIIYQNSYGNVLRDVHLEASNDNTNISYALYFGQGCYTTLVENVDAPRVRIYSATADRPTTLTFTNLDSGYVGIDNAGAITFIQPIMQSSVGHSFGLYRMNVVNCYTFTCMGGDFEDDDATHYMYYFDNVTQHCVSIGNWSTGFAGGYMVEGASGITGKRFLQDHKTQGFEAREGTWTPVLAWATPGTSTIVPTSATGSYVKVGNMVHCAFNHDNATFTNGTASGNLVLSGLPFTAVSSTTDWWGGTPTTQIGYPTNLQSIVVANNTKTAFFKKSDGAGSNVVVADVSGAGKYMRATFSYKCAN